MTRGDSFTEPTGVYPNAHTHIIVIVFYYYFVIHAGRIAIESGIP